MNQSNGNHEPVLLSWPELVSCIEGIRLQVLHYLRIVPGHHLLEFDDCKEEEEVVDDDRYHPAEVGLDSYLSLDVEMGQGR